MSAAAAAAEAQATAHLAAMMIPPTLTALITTGKRTPAERDSSDQPSDGGNPFEQLPLDVLEHLLRDAGAEVLVRFGLTAKWSCELLLTPPQRRDGPLELKSWLWMKACMVEFGELERQLRKCFHAQCQAKRTRSKGRGVHQIEPAAPDKPDHQRRPAAAEKPPADESTHGFLNAGDLTVAQPKPVRGSCHKPKCPKCNAATDGIRCLCGEDMLQQRHHRHDFLNMFRYLDAKYPFQVKVTGAPGPRTRALGPRKKNPYRIQCNGECGRIGCAKTFGDDASTSAFGRLHSHITAKPLVCPKCSKVYANRSNLNQHLKNNKTCGTAAEPVTCEFCGKKSNNKKALNDHMRRDKKCIARRKAKERATGCPALTLL